MLLLILAVLAIYYVIIVIAVAATAIASVIGGGILLYAGFKRKAKPPVSVMFIVFGSVMIVFSLFFIFWCLPSYFI